MIEGLRASERPSEQSCPLCREPVGRAPWVCAGCEVGYHTACALELGGCATLGCTHRGHGPPRTKGERFELSPERRAELAEAVADEQLAAQVRQLANERRPGVPWEGPGVPSQRPLLFAAVCAALALPCALYPHAVRQSFGQRMDEAFNRGSATELFLLLFLPLAAMAIVMLLPAWYYDRPRRR